MAEWGGASSAYEVGRGIDMPAFGCGLVHIIKPRVVRKVSRRALFIRTIFPVSGVMVLYDGFECTGFSPKRYVAL